MTNLIHNLSLLNNTRLEYNSDKDELYIWIYHDKNFNNGTYHKFVIKSWDLYLCTIRNGEFIEERIKWKQLV